MSLTALPVSASDLTQLQSGLEFITNPTDAANQATAINAPGATTTVFTYAATILNANISLSQVAMATTALMEGGTIAVGNTTTSNTLTFLTTQFLPNQVTVALANGYNPTVFAAESLGSALSTNANFNTNFVSLSTTNFATSVSSLTGVNASAIQQFVANWTAFFTANPAALQGRTVTQAAYGAAFGDAVGVALLNPTAANLQTVFSTNATANPFSPNTVTGLVANALINNAEGTYVTGVALGALPAHQPLQGEAGVSNTIFLTVNADTPNSGFSINPGGLPVLGGFTANAAKQVFAAPLQGGLQTITTGDNLVDTKGDGTLGGAGGNAFLLPGITSAFNFSGITTANLQAPNAGVTGFAGTDTGLVTVNNNNSHGFIALGTAGQGLGTVLTTYNSNNSTDGFAAVVLASAFSATTNTIGINITGNLGAPGNGLNQGPQGTSIQLAFAPDSGTAGYVNWNIKAANNEWLLLGQGTSADANGTLGAGFGSLANLVQTGTGLVEYNAHQPGDFAALKTFDGTAGGPVILTGAAANTLGGYYSSVGIDGDDGSGNTNLAGFLTSSAANILAPTSIKGSTTAANFVDLSGLTAANINAITTLSGNTATGVTNTLVLPNAVVEQAGTLAGDTGFQNIGDTALRGGTINLANFTNANQISLYGPEAINVAAVTINNGTPTFTLALNGNTGGAAQPGAGPGAFLIGFHNFIVNGPANTTDVFNLSMGNAARTFGEGGATGAGGFGGFTDAAVANSDTIGFFGLLGAGLTVNGYEAVNISVVDGPALPAPFSIFTPLTNVPDIIFGGIHMTPTVGGGEILNVTGPGDLISLINPMIAGSDLANIVSSTNNFVINANETGILAFGGTNALQVNGATSGGVIMVGGVDTNPAGATLTGSTTHWNALAGSTSVDVFTGGTGQFSPFIAVQGDVFGTNGGTGATFGDTVNLATGHTLNHIDIYPTNGDPIGQNGLDYQPLTQVNTLPASTITTYNQAGPPASTADLYQPGWAGLATGATPVQFGAENLQPVVGGFAGGISTSQVIVNGFVTGPGFPAGGGDIVTFSASEWGTGATPINVTFTLAPATALGLVDATITHITAGTDAVLSNPVAAGGVITPQVAGSVDVVEISQIEGNANALAQYLATSGPGGIGVIFQGGAAQGPTTNAHMLFAYSDGANVHIADVELATNGGAVGTGTAVGGEHVVGATDLVQLTGVSLAQLNAHNIHILA